MPADWNDDFSAYFDATGTWATPDIYCMAFAAMNERNLAIGGEILDEFVFSGTTGSTGGVNRLPQFNDDLQAASGTGGASAIAGDPIVSHRYGMAAVQSFVQNQCGSFVATVAADGSAVSLDDFDGAADAPDVTPLDAFVGGPAERWTWAKIQDRVLGGHDFTRKYPKEYADDAATTYAYPNNADTFAEGDIARNKATGAITLRSGGAWVPAPVGSRPDVVTAYGRHVAGDYIGPWLFNEVRDCLNALTVVISPCLLIARPYEPSGHGARWESFIPPSTGFNFCYGSTAADAKAAAEDAWAYDGLGGVLEFICGTPTTGDGNKVGGWGYGCAAGSPAGAGQPEASSSVVDNWSTSGENHFGWSARMESHRYRALAQRVGPPSLAKEARFYFYPVAVGTYDDNGTGYTENRWNRYDTVAANADAVVRSDWINPDIKTQPAWAADNTARGFRGRTDGVRSVVCLYDYGVSGGFRYTASSTGTCETLGALEVSVDDCNRHFCLARWEQRYDCLTALTTVEDTGERQCSGGVTEIGWVQQDDETGDDGQRILVWRRWVVTGQFCDGTDTSPCTRAAIGDDGDGDPTNNTDPLATPPGATVPDGVCPTCPTDGSACCNILTVQYRVDGVAKTAVFTRDAATYTSANPDVTLVCENGFWLIKATGTGRAGEPMVWRQTDAARDASACPPISDTAAGWAAQFVDAGVVLESVTCCTGAACPDTSTDCYGSTTKAISVTFSDGPAVVYCRNNTVGGAVSWVSAGSDSILCGAGGVPGYMEMSYVGADGVLYYLASCSTTGCPSLTPSDWHPVRKVTDGTAEPWDGSTGPHIVEMAAADPCNNCGVNTVTVTVSNPGPADSNHCDNGQSLVLTWDATYNAWLSPSTNSYLYWNGSAWELRVDASDFPAGTCDPVLGCGNSTWIADTGDDTCPPFDASSYALQEGTYCGSPSIALAAA